MLKNIDFTMPNLNFQKNNDEQYVNSSDLLGSLGIYTGLDLFNLKEQRQTEYPNFIYKYRDINLEDELSIKYCKKILLDEEIFFASPDQLNDINDIRLRIKSNPDKSKIIKYYKEEAKNLTPKPSPAKRLEGLNRFKNLNITKEDNEIIEQKIRETTSIFSCTIDPRNELMWAHYAGNHSGICVQIHRHCDLALSYLLRKVFYSNDYPESDFPLGIKEGKEFYLQKSEEWKYEKEYRLVIPHSSFSMRLSKNSVSSVILGTNTSIKNKEFIFKVNDARKSVGLESLKIFKTKRKTSSYGLNIVRIA